MERAVVLAGVAVVGLVGLVYIWNAGDPPQPVPVLAVAAAPTQTILVHVSGAVVTPGVVSIPSDSRVADAVAAAGGVTVDAVLVAINLAAVVQDGQQVIVPTEASQSLGSSDGRVAINVASATDLESLPGVGPVLAARIVAFRDDYGPFGAVEDLLDVPGIGESKLASLRDHIQVP